MTVEGVDISVYQAETPPLTGRDFVIARASIGQYLDSRYAHHAANVRAAGKVLGAYHYVRDEVPVDTQVAAFLSAARGADLLALDLEGSDGGTAGKAVARSMIAKLQATGRKIGLYHSESGYPELGQDWRWVAHWGVAKPGIAYDFHQYRGSPLDLDRWRGDLAGLHAFVTWAAAGGAMAIYERQDRTGTAVLPSGAKADGQRIGAAGWEKVKVATGPVTMHFDHRLLELTTTTAMDVGLHVTDGPLAGLYVRSSQVTETYNPAAVVPSAGDIAAAKLAGYADAKAKAIAAVQTI